MTQFPDDSAIEHLARRVLDASLPRDEWTHAAHFALALWLLRHRPESAGAEDFRAIIRRLNDAHGTPNTDTSGYHHTITIASIMAAASVLSVHDADAPLHGVLGALTAGPYGRSDWILGHWSRERLFGAEARREWLAPDLAPLPFRVPSRAPF